MSRLQFQLKGNRENYEATWVDGCDDLFFETLLGRKLSLEDILKEPENYSKGKNNVEALLVYSQQAYR